MDKMTYRRAHIILCIMSLAALACGGTLPAAVVDYTSTPAATAISRHAAVELRQVTGCWYLRETAGGTAIGSLCDEKVAILQVSGDWARTFDGWICRRAFGDDVRCVIP